MTFEVREAPYSTSDRPYWLVICTNRGRSYYIVYAGDKPSDDEIRKAWKEDRRAFLSYIS